VRLTAALATGRQQWIRERFVSLLAVLRLSSGMLPVRLAILLAVLAGALPFGLAVLLVILAVALLQDLAVLLTIPAVTRDPCSLTPLAATAIPIGGNPRVPRKQALSLRLGHRRDAMSRPLGASASFSLIAGATSVAGDGGVRSAAGIAFDPVANASEVAGMLERAERRTEWAARALEAAASELLLLGAAGEVVNGTAAQVAGGAERVFGLLPLIAADREQAGSPRRVRDSL
jgi:hypothetical protein